MRVIKLCICDTSNYIIKIFFCSSKNLFPHIKSLISENVYDASYGYMLHYQYIEAGPDIQDVLRELSFTFLILLPYCKYYLIQILKYIALELNCSNQPVLKILYYPWIRLSFHSHQTFLNN